MTAPRVIDDFNSKTNITTTFTGASEGKMEMLVQSLNLLDKCYAERIREVIEYYQQMLRDNRQYEWLIRKFSSCRPDSNNATSNNNNLQVLPEFQSSQQWLSMKQQLEATCSTFNLALAKDVDTANELSRRRLQEISELREEVQMVSQRHRQNLDQAMQDLHNAETKIHELEHQLATMEIEYNRQQDKCTELETSQNQTIAEFKQLMFVQQQEIVRLCDIIASAQQDDSDDPPTFPKDIIQAASAIVNSTSNTRRSSTALLFNVGGSTESHPPLLLVKDLQVELERERELNSRLKRLLQTNDHIRLVDEFNRLHRRSTQLELSNKRLLEHIKINEADFDENEFFINGSKLEEISIDAAIEDLVDQRNAWKQNTRLLERQVYNLQQELERVKASGPGLKLSQPNYSSPVISLHPPPIVSSSASVTLMSPISDSHRTSVEKYHKSQPNLAPASTVSSSNSPSKDTYTNNEHQEGNRTHQPMIKTCQNCKSGVIVDI